MTEEVETDIISLGDEIQIKKFAFDMACNCNDPSKFVITLCYSIWGYEALANRCVRKIPKKDERLIVTPKKVEALRKTFKDWLTKNGYQKQALRNEIKHINVYMSRAITGARRYLKLDVSKEPVLEEAHTKEVYNEKN